MNILIHDFAGHPFQAELSRELAARGHDVVHAWCGGVTTGRGALSRRSGDPEGLRFVDCAVGEFERYSPLRRLRSEWAYGRAVAHATRSLRPQVILSANTPLLSQARLWRTARAVGARRIYWLQDFLGRGTRAVLAQRAAWLGATLGRAWERLETALLRRSDAIIAITEDFGPELTRRRVRTPVEVVENWAPLDEIDVRPKSNPWSRRTGVADRPMALYAGTLGLKHDPEHLVAAGRAAAAVGGTVVVVSEGLGRDHLERTRAEQHLENLVLLDYVDYDVLPDVLGAADVCLVLLEREAGHFSVPSKLLTYLAAGRPVVAAVPAENEAARVVARSQGGIVVEPGAHAAFGEAVARILTDADERERHSLAARAYAERNFDVERIADRVLGVFAAAPTANHDTATRRGAYEGG